jgi:putative spermidine/putrescine transport system ATP-binding protein
VTQLYETPVNRFVASFVGDNTVLDGKVSATEGELASVQLPDGSAADRHQREPAPWPAAVVACMRPERIHVCTSPPTGLRPIRAGQRRADVIYFGDHLRLRCKVASQAEATVKMR